MRVPRVALRFFAVRFFWNTFSCSDTGEGVYFCRGAGPGRPPWPQAPWTENLNWNRKGMVLMKRHLHRLGAAAVSGALLASLLTACGGGITAETPSVVPESPRTADGAGCGGNPHRDGCGGQRGGGSGGAQPHRGYPAALVLRDLCHRRHL